MQARKESSPAGARTRPATPLLAADPVPIDRRSGAAARHSQVMLQQLYETQATRIYRYIYRKVGNREAAEDVTAQVFMKAAQHLDTTRDEAGQIAWLFQVARTTITDYWRVYYRGPSVSLDSLLETAEHGEFADVAADGAADLAAEDLAAQRVQQILAQLPENHRQVLTLRFLQGCSLKETAAAMNTTEGNVKVLQYRALQKAGQLRI
jgi:RNA polymerase sigma-70 factor (ECF subfamily)